MEEVAVEATGEATEVRTDSLSIYLNNTAYY